MIVLKTVKDMQAWADGRRSAGKRIGFVPTMGFLHDGHVALMREAKKRADSVVVSIFVNPAQFAPNEDLDKYPRDFEGDESKCENAGVEAIYYPSAKDMYPAGYQTYITVEELSKGLCGEARPGHFRGVATVCMKLFHAVKPHVAVFGMKDYQQLQVVKTMVRDLDLDLEIVGYPTKREADGLAMSSRNKYLGPDERGRAPALYKSLVAAQTAYAKGEADVRALEKIVKDGLKAAEPCSLDYVEIRDAESLKPIEKVASPAVIAIAVKVGPARLIDNIVIGN